MVTPHQTNAILIGRKPVMNYVMAALRLFNNEDLEEVVIKARGRNVCKAVEAVEMLKNLVMKGRVEVKDVKIYSEEVVDEEGKKRRVASIEIVVVRKG